MASKDNNGSKNDIKITAYIGEPHRKYINSLIKKGEYTTVSEIIRDLLRQHKKMNTERSVSGKKR